MQGRAGKQGARFPDLEGPLLEEQARAPHHTIPGQGKGNGPTWAPRWARSRGGWGLLSHQEGFLEFVETSPSPRP